MSEIGFPSLFAQGEKVAAWMPAVEIVLEWDLDGSLLTRSSIPRMTSSGQHFYQPAFDPDGSIVWLLPSAVSDPDPRNWQHGLFRLDTAGHSWVPVASSLGTFHRGVTLIGSDSSGLVLHSRHEGRIFWLALPQ